MKKIAVIIDGNKRSKLQPFPHKKRHDFEHKMKTDLTKTHLICIIKNKSIFKWVLECLKEVIITIRIILNLYC